MPTEADTAFVSLWLSRAFHCHLKHREERYKPPAVLLLQPFCFDPTLYVV
jgi:hypothetical protein